MLVVRINQAPRVSWPGSEIDVPVSFLTEAGVAVDPATVTFELESPESTVTRYVYGTDSQLSKQSTGNYMARVTADVAGRWRYRWLTTGAGMVNAQDGYFLVQRSVFVDDPDCYRDYV